VEKLKLAMAKALYGLLFVGVVPLLLVIWAQQTKDVVRLPVVRSLPWGITAAAAGVLLITWGMTSLWRLGGGLPMNAFPPNQYVAGGIYRVFHHPIYVGFGLSCIGISIAAGSASGLWLVSPVGILAATALVLGYELPDLHLRFGDAFPKDRLLPPDNERPPTRLERGHFYLTVLIPWFILYEGIVALGAPRDARIAYLPFEWRWTVWHWTEVFYISVYVVVLLAPLIVRTRHQLRWLSSRALLSMIVVFPLFLAVPLIAPPRPFVESGILAALLNFDRAHDGAVAAFPSYHVIWAALAASAICRKRWLKILGWTWVILVSLSCLTTGMHALIDVLAAAGVVWILFHMDHLWSILRNFSEHIANSWRESRVGPLRIINHGAYAALGVVVGIIIIDTLLGPGKSAISISIFAGGSIGAAIWAQWIEGSPALLRPLGFYGGMIGTAVAGILAALISGTHPWIVLAALVVAAPWIQGIGRLRCLVQGCCHGRLSNDRVGIRYVRPESRVSRVASLRGFPIHPTPLYSLLWNVLVALAVGRLYLLHTTAAMVGGVYLILSGLGRFVEEAYRGEPQTAIVAGLRVYQWMAIASVIVGAVITTIKGAPLTPEFAPHPSSWLVGLACGVLAWLITGVDFPESTVRFARLT